GKWTSQSGARPSAAGICRRNVDHAKLHPLFALPAVERETSGRVHPAPATLREGRAQGLAGGAKRDCIEHGAVARAQADADVTLADLVGESDRMSGKRHDRLRIA